MLRKSFVCFALFLNLFSTNNLQSQLRDNSFSPADNLIPKSPEASMLLKFQEIPVSKYTGIPEINIPLKSISEGEINIPISLNYHASGNKMHDVAGWTGLGWQLNAGGMITRKMHGLDDDANIGQGFLQVRKTHSYEDVRNWIWDYNELNSANVSSGCLDIQPDEFYFSFNGYNGKFVFDWQGELPILVSESPIKIHSFTRSNGDSGSIISWTLIDPKGYIYEFSSLESTTIYSEFTFFSPCTTGNHSYISSWGLTKITSPYNVNEYVEFMYDYYQLQLPWEGFETKAYKYIFTSNCGGDYNGNLSISSSRIDINGKQLNRIRTSGGEEVDFVATTPRTDVNKDFNNATTLYRLDKIVYRNKSQEITSQYLLNYFTNTRLKLKSVIEQDKNGVSLPPYELTYSNTSLPVDVRDRGVDHWGFSNYKNSTTLLPDYIHLLPWGGNSFNHYFGADRSPDIKGSKADVVEKIKYPTGAQVEFTYELNEYGYIQYQPVEMLKEYQEVAVSKSSSVTGTSSEWEYDTETFKIDYDNTLVTIFVNGYTWSPGFGGGALMPTASIEGVGTYGLTGHPGTGNGVDEAWHVSYVQEVLLDTGTYIITTKAKKNPNQYNGSDNITIQVNYNTLNEELPVVEKKAGGIRVQKMLVKDKDGSISNIKKYEYDMPDGKSSGVIYGEPQYLYEGYTLGTFGTECKYIQLIGASNIILGATQNNHIGYRRVTEIFGENAENGKIISEYTSPYEYGDGINTTKPFSPPVSNGYKTGLLLKETVFSNQNQQFVKAKESTFEYSFYKRDVNSIKLTYGKIAPPAYSGGWDDLILGSTYAAYPYYEKFASSFYEIRMGITKPKSKIIKTYGFDALDSLEIKEEYLYNVELQNLISTSLLNSDGIEYLTKHKYVLDYEVASATDDQSLAIKKLQEKNIVSIPIESAKYIKSGGIEKLVSASLLEFKNQTSFDLPLLKQIWNTELTSPKTGFAFSSINASGNFIKSNFYKSHSISQAEHVITNYDNRANILDYYYRNQNPLSLVWSKNMDKPLASVKNSVSSDVAYHGFDGLEVEGWNIAGNAVLNNEGKTSKSITINTSNAPKKTLVLSGEGQQRKYIFTAWVKSASNNGKLSIKVKNTNGTQVGNTQSKTFENNDNSWVKQKFVFDLKAFRTLNNIANSTMLNLEIIVEATQGNFQLDELKFHPIDAYMSTYAYDVDYKLLSIGNERDQYSYFFYDDYNRLSYTKDDDGFIRSHHDYHYAADASDQNWIKTTTVLVPNITTEEALTGLTSEEKQESISYFDGLGRILQSNQIAIGPSGHDVVSFYEYDAYGRIAKEYLPVPLSSNSGAYRSNIKTLQQNIYQLGIIEGVEKSLYPFSEKVFDGSPLNKVVEQSFPGASWQLETGKTLKNTQRANSVNDQVRDFYNNTFFDENKLWVEESENEDGKKVAVFKDKLGKTILKRQYGEEIKDVYNIYNLLGQLQYILSPEAVKWMKSHNDWNEINENIQELIYKYNYDSRGRLISKKIPGRGLEKFWYDRRDRQAASTCLVPVGVDDDEAVSIDVNIDGDGEVTNTNTEDEKEFKFIKYDKLDRIIQTGVYYSNGFPTNLDNYSLFEERDNTADGYTDNGFPTLGSNNKNQIMVMNYYDDYDLDQNGTADYSYSSNADINEQVTSDTRGLLTVSKTKVLNNANANELEYLKTINFINKYGQNILNISDHLLAGQDKVYNEFDHFHGRIIKTKKIHTSSFENITVKERYEYDKQGRNTKTYQQINNQGEIILSENVYNKLGTAIAKKIHSTDNGGTYLQEVNQKYNIRGWLTDINDVSANCGQTIDDTYDDTHKGTMSGAKGGEGNGNSCSDDLFSMKLYYQNADDVFMSSSAPQYGGNISSMRWKTASMSSKDTTLFGYNYLYDDYGQLTDALFAKTNRAKNNGVYTWNNVFDESAYNEQMSYDLNGNITSLIRTGRTFNQNNESVSTPFDNLTYSYNQNQLIGINDNQQAIAGKTGEGFIDGVKLTPTSNVNTHEYLYDEKGNMVEDKNKGIKITYNYLDLPENIKYANGNEIQIMYAATGKKLRKVTKQNATTVILIHDYIGNIEYEGSTVNNKSIDGLYHGQGRSIKRGNIFINQYNLTDHLGTTRVRYSDVNQDGIIQRNTEVIETSHYYPFGLTFSGELSSTSSSIDDHKYNGKELNTDFNLNWYDYQARWYDPAIARWHVADPMAEKYTRWSSYNYAFNNPVMFTDPDGMDPQTLECCTIPPASPSPYTVVVTGDGVGAGYGNYDPNAPQPSITVGDYTIGLYAEATATAITGTSIGGDVGVGKAEFATGVVTEVSASTLDGVSVDAPVVTGHTTFATTASFQVAGEGASYESRTTVDGDGNVTQTSTTGAITFAKFATVQTSVTTDYKTGDETYKLGAGGTASQNVGNTNVSATATVGVYVRKAGNGSIESKPIDKPAPAITRDNTSVSLPIRELQTGNIQTLGDIKFDSNQARQGSNGELIVRDINSGNDFGVHRNNDGSYRWYTGK